MQFRDWIIQKSSANSADAQAQFTDGVVDLPVVQQRTNLHSADCTCETMENPQVQYIDTIVDMSVMTERHVPVTMQLQVSMMKRVHRNMTSTQMPCIVPVAMRDKLTDEESAHEHLADSLRGTGRTSKEVIMESFWRTLLDSGKTRRGTGWCSQELRRQDVQDSFNCREDHSMPWTNGPSRGLDASHESQHTRIDRSLLE